LLAIREILFPTDLSPQSERALEAARLLAGSFRASITLCHVIQVPDHRFAHWAFAQDHEIWERAERQARECLERKAEALEVPHRVVVERRVSIHRALIELIRATQPDLIVMATHGREGLSHLLLGSVTEKVVQHAFRPVLCVREGENGPTLPCRRILVPTDLSLASRLAFPMAALLARTFGSEILGVHVAASPTLATLTGAAPPGREPVNESSLWEFFRTDFPDVPITAQVHTGPAWDRIVHTARVEKADLVVMGTRGHDSLADRVLGSTTERVVRHAPCPVLVA